MWVDELYSYNLIQDPSLRHMLAASGDQCDGSPPLYYLFVRPWAALFSTHELSLRLFSSVAFCAAFALIWNTLRRAFDFWPSAVSLALVVGTSHVIRFENSNVRFYGILFALISLAVWLAVRLGERERPGPALLAANALTQGALVLCHPLGGIYGAAILAAVFAGDWLFLRRTRLSVALSYPRRLAGAVLWFPQILRQADLNGPTVGYPVPEFHDLPGRVVWRQRFLSVVPALCRARHLAGRLHSPPRGNFHRTARTFARRLPLQAGAGRQMLIAAALVSLPLLLWIFSRAVPSNPLFLARYVIGVSIGWAIVLAQLSTFLFRPLESSGERVGQGNFDRFCRAPTRPAHHGTRAG